MNPRRGHDAQELQDIRDALEIERINAWKSALNDARLAALLVDLEALGVGVGDSVEILDSLISESMTSGLSANQGRILKALIDGINVESIGADVEGSALAAYLDAKDYADSIVVGLWDDRGVFDASGGAYPTTGGSGVSGAINKGDIWTISVAGTLPTGRVVEAGDAVRALVDSPTNTAADWAIVQNNIGYVPENNVNKASNFLTENNTLYPTILAVVNAFLRFDAEQTLTAPQKAQALANLGIGASNIIGGSGNTVSSTSVAINCTNCTISGSNTTMTNCKNVALSMDNAIAEGSLAAPYNFNVKTVLKGYTTDSAAVSLTTDNAALSASNAPRACLESFASIDTIAIHKVKISAFRDVLGSTNREWLYITERVIKVSTSGASNVHTTNVSTIGTDKANFASLTVTASAANGSTSPLNISVAVTGGLSGNMYINAEVESCYMYSS